MSEASTGGPAVARETVGAPAWRRSVPTLFLRAGVALLVAGMALAIAGVLVAPLFVPGVWLILFSFLLLAAAGITGVVSSAGSG